MSVVEMGIGPAIDGERGWFGSANAAALELIGAAEAHDRRFADRLRRLQVAALTVVLLNVADVQLTQAVLRSHPGAREGNLLVAGMVMTGWIWLPKVGLPLLVGAAAWRRPTLSPVRELGVYAVWAIYWAIVIWNIHNLLG